MIVEWQAARAATRIWWPAAVGAAVIAAPAFLLGQCSGERLERNRQTAAQIKTVEKVGAANTAAAEQRGHDNTRIATNQEERAHAIQSAPDQAPSPSRLARACVQLRQQGTPAERLPAECRS